MIEFVILKLDQPEATVLEFVRVNVSLDLTKATYASWARQFSLAEIEKLSGNAFRMKDPTTGQGYTIAVMHMTDKVKNAPEAAQRHIRDWLNHPLRVVIRKEIERSSG
ncbi:hypothetical protein [Mycoplana ramosa]|uniref:Uncharacterized protein n=1 Tax=Mycoplana ramosa TaxID=40837 RepID=A0ABW3YTD2_MYCRA